jgi:subtilase family serine protease
MQPDLTLSAADISGDGPLVVTVHNEGPVDANGVLVELRDGGETGAMLDRQTLPSVAAGGSAAFLAAAPTGAYTLYVTVDPDNTIDEAAEGNNLAIRDVEVFSRIYLPLTLR